MAIPPLYGHEGIRDRLEGAIAPRPWPQVVLLWGPPRRGHQRPALRPAPALGGDAERLVPQTGAETAANALLKAVEEPPADTVFVLTSAQPDALLPTILSRVVRVRMARSPDSIVTAFVQRELGVTTQREVAQRVAAGLADELAERT